MIDVMREIFGEYQLVDGQVNFEYIGAVVLFGLVLYCAFRLLGIAFGSKR